MDYRNILNRFEQEAKTMEMDLYDGIENLVVKSNDDHHQLGYYSGFSKAVYMLDRIIREEHEKEMNDYDEEVLFPELL